MEKTKKIISFFNDNFADNANWEWKDKISEGKFKCEHAKENECNVSIQMPCSYTPAIGDEKSNIMIIADSPSTAGGEKCYISGRFEHFITLHKINNSLDYLWKFIRDSFNHGKNTYPYFTDIMKCRLDNPKKRKIREENCCNKYLIWEINTIKPEIILCLGGNSRSVIQKLKDKDKIFSGMQIIPLTHYSPNANLHLSIYDKTHIIWKIEAKKITREQAKKEVLKLSKIKNLIDACK